MIPALDALPPPDFPAMAAVLPPPAAPVGFARLFEQQVREMDAQVASAESAVRALAAGGAVELHEVMIGLERARLAVQTFVQVRNRLVESYQDLMRMQM